MNENAAKRNLLEIAPGLYRISIPMSLSLPYIHVFAAVERGRMTLFDTGLNSRASLSVYKKVLPLIGSSLEKTDRIFLTHYHVDHCGMAGLIKSLSDAEIHLSKIDYAAFSRRANQSFIGLAGEKHGMDAQTIQAYCLSLDGLLKWASVPFTTDLFLNDEMHFMIGGRPCISLSTPGHTHGHHCFYFPEEQLLLAGDSILPDITPNLSPDPSSPSFLPLENFIRSLDRLAELPIKTVYPGHGEPFTDLRERVEEIKRHHDERKALVLRAASPQPITAYDISKKIFGDGLTNFDQGLAFNEIYIHLVQLEKENLIERLEKNGLFLFGRC